MIQPSQREKMLILTAAAVGFVAITALIWGPLLRSWRSTSLQYGQKKEQFKLVQETIAQQSMYEEQYKELHAAMAARQGSAAMPDVLQKVGDLFRNAGINVRSRTPQPERAQRGFTEVPIDYSVEATTESLVRFLYEVKIAQDLMDIPEMKITPAPGNPGTLRADLKVITLRSAQ